jgi:O-antigen/teichoic acid export membrane protein
MMRPVNVITSPLTGVMVAGLAKARDDRATRTEIATRFFRLAGLGLVPCAIGLMVVAPDVMLVLGGPRWTDAGTLLFILAPSLLAHGLNNLGAYLLSAAGRAGRLLAAMTLLLMLLGLAMLAGLFVANQALGSDRALDAAGQLALAQTVAVMFVWLVPYLWYCLRTADIEPLSVLRVLLPALRASMLMGLSAWLLRLILQQTPAIPPAVRLGVVVAAGIVAYWLLAQREVRWAVGELTAGRGAEP